MRYDVEETLRVAKAWDDLRARHALEPLKLSLWKAVLCEETVFPTAKDAPETVYLIRHVEGTALLRGGPMQPVTLSGDYEDLPHCIAWFDPRSLRPLGDKEVVVKGVRVTFCTEQDMD